MDTLRMTNYIIAVVFFVCYTYQFLYIPVPWLLAKRKAAKAAALEATPHNYAVLICARNESAVIADLIGSLRSQTYDQSLLHIFVLADNCTDDTSDIARSAGATVYERFNNVQVGKGYALQTLLGHLEQDYPAGFDGYIVFDADNILDPGYIAAMNRTFSQGTISSPATATAKTTATTGSPPATPCGSCGRAATSTTPAACWVPAAPSPAQASSSAGPCWRRPAPGPSIC